jgi:hypothetical protein
MVRAVGETRDFTDLLAIPPAGCACRHPKRVIVSRVIEMLIPGHT